MTADGILLPASALFGAVVRLRNRLYGSGVLAQRRLPSPVISVGNLTTGGAGKTPLVVYIASLVEKTGHTPVLLTRGYGRKSPRESLVVQPSEQYEDAAGRLGDEPALLRRRIPNLWLGLSADRYAVGKRILQEVPEPVFLLDDGFQHRSLRRDLDIVLLDRTQPFITNHLLPRGSLREPPAALRRCHAVVLNGAPPADREDTLEKTVAEIHPAARIFHCRQEIVALIPWSHWQRGRPMESPAVNPGIRAAFLVAAVGNPGRFESDVRSLGIDVVGRRFFRDHHVFDEREWRDCRRAARATRAEAVLTTEKDAVRFAEDPGDDVFVAVQDTRFPEECRFDGMVGEALGLSP